MIYNTVNQKFYVDPMYINLHVRMLVCMKYAKYVK